MAHEVVTTFYSAEAYDAFLEQQRQKRMWQHIQEARQRANQPTSYPGATFAPKVQRTLAELKQYIDDVLSGKDVEQAQAQTRRYARSIKVYRGGSPGLSR